MTEHPLIAPFEASNLKIARARRHLQELETEISSYMARKPFDLVVEEWEMNDKVGFVSHAWVVRIREPTPKHLSAVLGDIIHNLRTAFDLLACDLVRLKGKNVKNVYFPFCDHPGGLNEMIKRRNFDRAGSDAVALVKSLKPYRGGNDALRAIHDLDVLDKHQALVPVIGAGTSPQALIKFFGNDPTRVPAIASKIDRNGQTLTIMPPVTNLPVGTKLPAKWDLVLGQEADPFGGYRPVELLHNFAKLTERIVQLFAGKFGSAEFGPRGN
jgi:hypothetical protein